MTSRLQQLMAAHDAALIAYDAREDDYDRKNDVTGHALDAALDAILAHRPTLDEVPAKAAFMLRKRTFTEWGSLDQRRLIEALTPVDVLVDTARNPVENRIPPARPCPAGLVSLASIVGLAICGLWIAITWRAWT